MYVLLASFVLILELVSLANAFDCTKFNSNMGATFDLSDLVRTPGQPPYAVEDGDIPCTTYVEQNYTYNFNVCGTVTDVPYACTRVPGIGMAGAVQLDKRATPNPYDDWCYNVGSYSESTTKVALLDQEDPTKGISVTYYGDYCSSPAVQRRFIVELSCADKLNAVPTHAIEYSHCVYTVTMPSVYGCPLQCPIGNRKLCGGQGHCAYDRDLNSARCFCNKGFTGKDCLSTAATSLLLNYSPLLLGLIITLFVIIGILVGAILLLIRQVSVSSLDLQHYQALKGEEEGNRGGIGSLGGDEKGLGMTSFSSHSLLRSTSV